MAEVPYNPVPTVAPQVGGDRVEINAPPQAFGTNIGEAISGMGRTLGQVGDEIFSRAIAIQDLKDESDARNAQMNFATEASQEQAKFDSMKGADPQAALQQHLANIQAIREKYGSQLSAPMAKRYYDADSMPFAQRLIFSSAGHAGSEFKEYTINNAGASMANIAGTVINPHSDNEFQQKLAQGRRSLQTWATASGYQMDDPKVTEVWNNFTSAARMNQILEVAKTNPVAGFDLLKKAEDANELNSKDDLRLNDTLTNLNRAIGSQTLINSVWDPDKSLKELEDEVQKKAPDYAHGDPLFAPHAMSELRTRSAFTKQAERNDAAQSMTDIQQVIAKGFNGGPMTTLQQLMTDPTAAKIYNGMTPDDQKRTLLWMNAYNRARFQKGMDEKFNGLMWLSNEDTGSFLDRTANPESFSDLSQPQIHSIIAKRGTLMKHPEDNDPRTRSAIGYIQDTHSDELNVLGIYHRDNQNPDPYDQYAGTLAAALDEYQSEYGKRADYDTIVNKIGPAILKRISGTGGWFSRDQPLFEVMGPRVQQMVSDAAKQGHDITPFDARRIYFAQMFQTMFGKPTKKEWQTPAPTSPTSNQPTQAPPSPPISR